ncbi:hypothetical protein E4T39_07373 [Aureobasidium subglaciale]|nr:hypothetical protein E4T39_07373 [Aureobasidium subglaciale]
MSPAQSDGEFFQANQSATDNWLLQRSYHGVNDIVSQQVPWSFQQPHSGYNDEHQHGYQYHSHDRPSYGNAGVQYSAIQEGRPANPTANMNHYTVTSSDEAQRCGDYHAEQHNDIFWQCPQAMPKPGHIHPPLHTDSAISDSRHSFGPSRDSFFAKLSPPIATPCTQISPTSSYRDMDDNASSVTTNTAIPTHLIPDPPTELIDPPTEDMSPSDKTMVPQRRNLRDSNHLYMPRWIRGDGKQREGWCGQCRPGKWLSLKRSTYWYHKNFCHGITVMGTPFPRPTRTRALADDKGWEGFCGSCRKWIVLNGGKKSHTSWFRHAYKCNPAAVARSSPSGSFTY